MALSCPAEPTDQGDSSICVCAALAMAATEGDIVKKFTYFLRDFLGGFFSNKDCLLLALDHIGIDASQLALQSHLVNTSERVRKKNYNTLPANLVGSFVCSLLSIDIN